MGLVPCGMVQIPRQHLSNEINVHKEPLDYVLTSSVTQLARTLPHTVENRSPVVKLDSRSNSFTLFIAGMDSSGPSNNLNLKPNVET
jgi:hypothetical protein